MGRHDQNRFEDRPIRAWLALVIAAALLAPSSLDASEAENEMRLGDAISGVIDSPEDEDTFGFDAVAGTVVSCKLKATSEDGAPPELRLFDPDGAPLDLTPFVQIRMTRRSAVLSLKNLIVGTTGRYLFALSMPSGRGEYYLSTRARFPHRIRRGGLIRAGEERSVSFHALPGSRLSVAVRKRRNAPLALEIVDLLDSTGKPAQIDELAQARRRGVVLKGVSLNRLDVYQLRFRNTSAAAGVYKIDGVIRPPRRRSQRLTAREPDSNVNPSAPHQIWQFQTGGPVRAKPFVSNGVVYVGANDGYFYALDAATGDVLWRYETGEPIISSPVVSNGRVFVGCNDHRLYAFDKGNGLLLWTFETGGVVQSSPAVAGDSVFAASYDGFVYTLDAATGQLLWRFQTGGLIWTSPVVAGGMLFVGSTDGFLYAIEADTGNLIWQYTTSWNYIISDPIVQDGTLYVAAYEERVFALDAATGVVKWIHYGGNWITTLPLLKGGVLYYGVASANTLYALDVSSGIPLWQIGALDARQSILFVKDAMLYAMSKGGTLRVIDTEGGRVKAVYDLGVSLNALRLAEDGRVFVGSENDGVLAFGL